MTFVVLPVSRPRVAAWGWLPWLWLLPFAAMQAVAYTPDTDALLVGRVLAGRQVRQQHLGVDAGLSHALVHSVVQDRRGFVWIGTEEGLNRYDGHEVRVFGRSLNPAAGLRGGRVAGLLADPDGPLWVMMGEGTLSRFDPATETFRHFHATDAGGRDAPRFYPNALARGADGMLWLGSDAGLWRFDPRRESFQVFRQDPHDSHQGPADDRVAALLPDGAGGLWVGSRAGLDRRNVGGRFRTVLDGHEILSLAPAPGGLWVGTEAGLLRLDGERVVGHYRAGEGRLSLRHDQVHRLLAAGPRGVWVGTSQGLHLLVEISAGSSPDPEPVIFLEDLQALSLRPLAVDRDGGLWSAARGRGVIRLDPHGPVFRQHPLVEDPAQREPAVLSLGTAPDGVIWIGTWGKGLYRLDPGQHVPRPFGHAGTGEGGPGDSISRFVEDRAGNWWVGSYDRGLSRWDPVRRRFQALAPGTGSIPSVDIQALAPAPGGGLWIGVHERGLYHLPPAGGDIRRHRHDPQDPASLSGDDVLTLYPDRQGTLWVGTANGLNRLLPDGRGFRRYRHDPADPASLSDDFVKSLLEDRAGRFWVATNLGLNLLDRDTGRFRAYTTDHGLPHNRVNSLLEDSLGFLWLGTANGLSRFDPERQRFSNYGPLDGLPGRLFFYPAAARDPRGRLYFGGPEGLFSLDPRDFVERPRPPPPTPVLTGLRLFHQPVAIGADSPLPRTPGHLQELTLSHHHRVFSLEFVAPSFSAPQRQRYGYQLAGFDDSWRETVAGQRMATFTGLPPGRYQFQVRVANGDGPWSPPSRALTITVLPAWWATLWFRGLLTLALLGLLAGGYRWRTGALARNNRRLVSLVAERTRDLEAEVAIRKAREAELQHSERRLRRLLELAPLPIGIIPANGTLPMLNRAFTRLYGYSAMDVPDRATWLRLAYPDPAYRAWVDTDRRMAMEQARRVSGEPVTRERRISCRDGQVRHVLLSMALIDDQQVWLHQDITELRRVEQRLREREEFLTTLYEGIQVPLFIVEVDADGELRFAGHNPAHRALTGYTEAEIRGRRPEEVADLGEQAATLREHYQRCIEVGAPIRYEERLVLKGRESWWLTQLSPLRDESGRITRLIGSSLDISERRAMEEDLRRARDAAEAASRAKSLFLGTISHELRTPLNAILGFARLLPEQGGLTTDQQRAVAVIQRSGQHLLALIEDLLDVTRIEAGRLALVREPMDLSRLLEEVLSTARLREPTRAIVLHGESRGPGPVYADAGRLRQILANLLDNALKYSDTGEIAVSVRPLPVNARPSGWIRLRFQVEDAGIGIPAARLEAALNAFERVHDMDRGSPGVGLGLALCQRLVRLMGGELQLQSRVAGAAWASTARHPPPPPDREHGTVVWFDLTLELAGETAASAPPQLPLAPSDALPSPSLPAPETLAALHEWLADGDVQALITRAEAALNITEHPDFWQRVLALASEFRLKELEHWLGQCRDSLAPTPGED